MEFVTRFKSILYHTIVSYKISPSFMNCSPGVSTFFLPCVLWIFWYIVWKKKRHLITGRQGVARSLRTAEENEEREPELKRSAGKSDFMLDSNAKISCKLFHYFLFFSCNAGWKFLQHIISLWKIFVLTCLLRSALLHSAELSRCVQALPTPARETSAPGAAPEPGWVVTPVSVRNYL